MTATAMALVFAVIKLIGWVIYLADVVPVWLFPNRVKEEAKLKLLEQALSGHPLVVSKMLENLRKNYHIRYDPGFERKVLKLASINCELKNTYEFDTQRVREIEAKEKQHPLIVLKR
jgi:hypothetical protein